MSRAAVAPLSRVNRVQDADTEAELCEACYRFIVDFGIENVVACLGRATRLRAGDYLLVNRRSYLRHQRASSTILSAYQLILDDCDAVERILEEEEKARGIAGSE